MVYRGREIEEHTVTIPISEDEDMRVSKKYNWHCSTCHTEYYSRSEASICEQLHNVKKDILNRSEWQNTNEVTRTRRDLEIIQITYNHTEQIRVLEHLEYGRHNEHYVVVEAEGKECEIIIGDE